MVYNIKSNIKKYSKGNGLIYEQKLRQLDGQVLVKNKVITSNKKDTIDAINLVADKIGLNVCVENKDWKNKTRSYFKSKESQDKEKIKEYFSNKKDKKVLNS